MIEMYEDEELEVLRQKKLAQLQGQQSKKQPLKPKNSPFFGKYLQKKQDKGLQMSN